MRYPSFILFLLVTFSIQVVGQLNISELSRVNYGALHATQLNDIWGYVDETGIEYALVGARDGVSIVSLENPSSPVEVYWHQGNHSVWRDLKVYGDYAYITTEAQSGLLIIDLSPLPSAPITTAIYYQSAGVSNWKSAHNLYIDEEGFAYIFGANRGNGGVIILDVATDPLNPIEIGVFDNWYAHDGYARDGLLYLAHILDGFISIVDITDRSNPILLGTANTPSNFAHNIWPSDDGNFVFTTDEVSGAYLTAFDVSDPTNIFEVDRIQSSPGLGIVPHNAHVLDNWLVTSYYTDGVTIHDISQPHNMVEVGNFDTSPLQNMNTQGCWGAYPFLPSGILLATDIEQGLFVLQPNYKRASYLEGIVSNSVTNNPVAGVSVQITGHNQITSTTSSGDYSTGIDNEGTYSVEFSKVAYFPQTVEVTLVEMETTLLNIELEPMNPFSVNINVVDKETGDALPQTFISLIITQMEVNNMTNGLGESNSTLYYETEYELIVGKWGFRTTCQHLFLNPETPLLTIELEKGIYDDFSFDFGWSTISTAEAGEWIRAVPNPTEGFSNPGEDAPFDCGNKAFVTGNESFDPNVDNVTDGIVTLISPVFDLTTYEDPYINYWTYFYNEHGPFPPDDTLEIILSNGLSNVRIDYEAAPESLMRQWVPKSIRVSDHITPTATMQLFIRISDFPETVNITEAAFDFFSITPQSVLNVEDKKLASENHPYLYPNPTNSNITFKEIDIEEIQQIHISDMHGRIVLNSPSPSLSIDVHSLQNGMYFVTLIRKNGGIETLRFVKE
jgi:choice-of-anchor B domain-containing protein